MNRPLHFFTAILNLNHTLHIVGIWCFERNTVWLNEFWLVFWKEDCIFPERNTACLEEGSLFCRGYCVFLKGLSLFSVFFTFFYCFLLFGRICLAVCMLSLWGCSSEKVGLGRGGNIFIYIYVCVNTYCIYIYNIIYIYNTYTIYCNLYYVYIYIYIPFVGSLSLSMKLPM